MIAKKETGRDDHQPAPCSPPQPEGLNAPPDGGPVFTSPASDAHLSDELLAHQAALEIRNAQLEESQRKLEKERKKFNHLFDAAPVGYLILDRHGIVTEVNLTFTLMTGSSRNQILGKPFTVFLAPADAGAWDLFLRKVFQGVTRESCDINLHTASDQIMSVMIDGILNNSGHACLIAVTDITGLKRAVEDRFIMAKLDAFNVMAGGIAHDFNNLLAVILMNLDLSRMLIPPGADLQHLMEEANKAVKQATNLTDRLLNLGESTMPVRKPVKLNEFFQHSVELALAGSNVTASFALADDLDTTSIDPRQFERVIRNVVLNAREAMPDGGTIEVQAANETLISHGPTTLPDGNYVRLSIIDHGMGIHEDDRTKIFDPYFSTKKRGAKKGLGLGLTICHSIMKKHGGAIFVESEFGTGTKVHLLLPASRGEAPGDLVVEPEAATRLGRILIMDDEDGVRKSVSQVLQVFGHEVAVATEGQEAIELYRQALADETPFDVVLLDLTVRDGMGGREAIETLKQIDPQAKAIVMSGFTQDPVIMNYEDYGFCDYLIKPFGRDQLREVLGKLMREKPAVEPGAEVEAPSEREFDSLMIVRPVRDERGRYVDAVLEYANESWRADHGFKDRDPAGLRIKESLPVYADRVHFMYQVAETRRPFRYVKSMAGDDSRWFDMQLIPYGERVIVFGHEVTREYRLEYAVRQSEERFRAALEFAPDITALFRPVFDRVGHLEDVELIYANRSGMDCWYRGAPLDRIKGHCLFADRPELRTTYLEIFRNVAESGREFRDIIEDDTAGGRVWLDVRIAMFIGGIVYTSRNVTPQRQAEEALRHSLEQLKEAQRAARIGNWECDLAGYDFVWSDELHHILGTSPGTPPEKLSEQFWSNIIHPDDRPRVEHAFARAIGNGHLFRLELKVRVADERIKYVEMRGAVVYGPEGKARRLRGTMQDISERKITEIELVEAHERLNYAQESGDVALWDLDMTDNNHFWSPQLFRMYGLDPEKTMPSMENWISVLHPDDRARAVAETKAAMEGKGSPVSEFRIVRPSGEIRWISNRGNIVMDDTGRPLRFSGACIDVTERKLIEASLQIQQRELAEAQRIGHVGSWRWNPERDEVYWSEELFRIFGLEPDTTGKGPTFKEQVEKMFTPESAQQLKAAVDKSRTTGIPYELTVELTRPNGERRHGVARGEWRPENKNFYGTFMDITELHNAQVRLDDTQRHEMIGRLAGGVAHDFNNQLQAILGATELMLSWIKPSQPEYEHLIDIQKAGQHSAELTRQLLAFSRQQLIHPAKIDLNDEITDMLRMIVRLIGESIRVEWNPGPALAAVMMDPAQLKQIMVNLCVNARDAMEGRGVIRISTRNIACNKAFCSNRPGFKPGKYVQLTVTDTGHGMTPEVVEHIFEPFFTTKEFGNGAGLGLATVDGAIRQNNGYIEVESEPGAGATFCIYFPACPEPAPAALPPQVAENQYGRGNGETILLIDDDRAVLDIGQRLLESLNYHVIASQSAEELLEMVRNYTGKIDLLITDVVMPDLSGPELAEQVMQLRPDIKCLYMSGYTANHIAREGKVKPGVDIMEKPFTRKILSERVKHILQSQHA